MKNVKPNAQKITVIFAVVLSLLISTRGLCQRYVLNPKSAVGFSLMSQVCANGYGIQYLPSFIYKKGRGTYSIAPTIQKRKFNLSGVQVRGEYALTGSNVKCDEDCPLELFVFLAAAYHQNAMMGVNTERDEKQANESYTEKNIGKLRFSSVETYAGFGLKIPILKKVKWTGSVGAGYFQSINHPSNLYYKARNFGLIINTGISMDFK